MSIEKVVAKFARADQSDDLAFWLTRTPAERIGAVEVLRLQTKGDDGAARQGLQRVCFITQRS